MKVLLNRIIFIEGGFTLIELLVAMMILSLLVVVFASTTTVSFKEYKFAGNKTIALNYARQVLEEIKLLDVKPVVDNTEKSFANPKYSYKISIVPYNTAISSKLYSVFVSVYYKDNNTKKHVDLATLAYWAR